MSIVENVKDLKSLLTPNEDKPSEGNSSSAIKAEMTYHDFGYVRAGDCRANIDTLEPCLLSVVSRKTTEMTQNQNLIEQHRVKIQKEIEDLRGQKKQKSNDLDAKEKALAFEEKKIEDYRRNIAEIRENPSQVLGGESPSKANFFIGLFIILMLTGYLFVFYSSTSYSAFFKGFTISNSGVVEAIFDAQALQKAWNESWTELLLICLIPAVFFGLGYLIHRFSDNNKKEKGNSVKKTWSILKIVFLLIVTFLFDAILAYSIDEKIYDLNRIITDPPFSVSIAASDVRFWLIIFSGFVVYVIWGLVFNFVMDAYYKLDRVGVSIRNFEDRIAASKQQCNTINSEIQTLNNEIARIDAEINQKNVELDQNVIIVNEIHLAINDFVTGWLSYMTKLNYSESQISEVNLVAKRVKESIN